MPSRRKPRTPSGAATAAATTSASAPASRIYESSAPAPHQLTFPPRQKIIRKYGRRSLPATLGSAERRRTLRQSTLTQIDYVQSSAASASGGAGLRFGELEVEGEDDELGLGNEGLEEEHDEGGLLQQEEEIQQPRRTLRSARKTKPIEGSAMAEKEKRPERGSKRRKTTGDEPTIVPSLQRKGSSFHTQTLTQFLGNSAPKLEDDGLRVVGEEEDAGGLPLPGSGPTPVKQRLPPAKASSKDQAVATAPSCMPTAKRIKVDPYEVPSSQPTPCTPMLSRYSPLIRSPPLGHGSPLTQKSANLNVPLPNAERVSKVPRTLVIQDSYSMGSSSEVFPSSSAAVGDTPAKKQGEETPSQRPKREPLGEIPVASLELGQETPSQRQALAELPVASLEHGVGSTPNGETPTARRKRMFVEIPDSDDELESVGSTPLRPRSTQQTPLKSILSQRGFQTPNRLASGPRPPGSGAVAETPGSGASLGKSDKENESPGIQVFEDDAAEETASEGDPGSPTPTLRRMASQLDRSLGRASQSTAKTASQFWAREEEGLGGSARSSRTVNKPPTQVVEAAEAEFGEENVPGTPTPAPRESPSQHRGTARKDKEPSEPQADDGEDLTASEAEEENVPTSILRKRTSQKIVRIDDSVERTRKSTPEPVSESSLSEAPGTPTQNIRRVQIELPPPSTAEEIYEETPQKPSHKKSSPIYQRHTQRSQFHSQGLESQRVPLDVIRSLGPQTDRSDVVISIQPDIVDEIVKGTRDHEFRTYRFPIQVLRCWIYITAPVQEVKYMATLGPAQEPGQIDSTSGLGNAEFNAGTSGFKFAHKLLQVYQLNNPVPLEDMPDNGLGEGPPQKYRYIPPVIVGQLLANLRCALFAEEGEDDDSLEEEGKEGGKAQEGGVTISQELEEQLRSDIIHSTQLMSSEQRRRQQEEEEDIILESPVKTRPAGPQKESVAFAHSPVRSSQRLRHHKYSQQHQPSQPARIQRHQRTSSGPRPKAQTIRPSQATTASDLSQPSSPVPPTPTRNSIPTPTPRLNAISIPSSSPSQGATIKLSNSNPASVPRPPLPESSELSLPDLPEDEDGSSLLPLPPGGLMSSSQAVVLPPDSLLVEEVGMAPEPVVWDSDDDNDDDEEEDM
ncbi:hypothetical protein VTI74DRAFT_4120 [Chaetomium olivicolor]